MRKSLRVPVFATTVSSSSSCSAFSSRCARAGGRTDGWTDGQATDGRTDGQTDWWCMVPESAACVSHNALLLPEVGDELEATMLSQSASMAMVIASSKLPSAKRKANVAKARKVIVESIVQYNVTSLSVRFATPLFGSMCNHQIASFKSSILSYGISEVVCLQSQTCEIRVLLPKRIVTRTGVCKTVSMK